MDAATALIGLGIFIISAIVIYIISVFGTREKTYEEAIAEQRRNRLSEQLDLRSNHNEKLHSKDKNKLKKPIVKSKPKEKPATSNSTTREELPAKPSNLQEGNALNKEKSDEKLKKKDIKPKQEAVLKRERSVPNIEHSAPLVSSENTVKAQKTKSESNIKQNSSSYGKLEHKESSTKIEVVKNNSKEVVKTNSFRKQEESNKKDSLIVNSPSRKTSKSKLKADLLVSGDQLVNMAQFMTQLKETVLTGEEIETLIEVLLNKQQGEGNEWLQKGQKQDSVTQLKKRLAELEQQIQEQTSLAASATTKVREIRNESNHEKTRYAKIEKELREKLTNRDQEVSTLTSNLKLSRDLHSSEVGDLQEKMKVYSSKMNDTSSLQKLQDEKAILEQSLAKAQAEQMKSKNDSEEFASSKQSLESILATVKANEQKAHCQIQELNMHIQKLESGQQEDVARSDGKIVTLEQQLRAFQTENAKLKERLQIEENASKGVPNLKKDYAEAKEKIEAARNEKSGLENEVKKLLGDLQDVRSKLQEKEIAISVASEEKVALAGRLAEMEESSKQNGDINHAKQSVVHELESSNAEKEKLLKKMADELSSNADTIQRLNNDLDNKTSAIKNFNYDMDSKLQQLEDLKLECCQRRGECERLRSDVEQERGEVKAKLEVVAEQERFVQMEALKRLSSPFFEIDGNLSHSAWMGEFERRCKDLLEKGRETDELQKRLTSAEETNANLEGEVEHYKTVMTETESILSKLQSSVEEEEDSWKQKLQSKDDELNRLRGEMRILEDEKSALEESLDQIKAAEEMQQKLRELQAKLQSEENDRRLLESKHAKEIERLECDIKNEKETSRDLKSQTVKLSSLVQIGKDSLRAEQELVKDLQVKLEATMNAAANGFPKEPNAVEHVESVSEKQ